MVFQADMAFALGLIALVASAALIMWSSKEGAACKLLGKIVGYVALVAAVLTLLCTGFNSVRYWDCGGHGKHGKHWKMHKQFYRGGFYQGKECPQGKDCPCGEACDCGDDCPCGEAGGLDCPYHSGKEGPEKDLSTGDEK